MSIRCPTLVIHHQAGKEYWAEQEIGDILFPYDFDLKIEKTVYRGVLLVYTSIKPLKAYRLVKREILTSVDKVIPVTTCLKTDNIDELFSLLDKLIRNQIKGTCINLVISLRGSLKQIEKLLVSFIREHALVNRRCKQVLYLESIDDLLLIGHIEE
ncbi:MAG: hypothetical protein GSR79_07155 [Desulfurococcales archaeon]|nr:hypothetical protein [Desulfurococcales archaeon]